MNNQKVFLDSDSFIALSKPTDSNHIKAKKIHQQLLTQPTQYFVSNLVFSETITVISQKLGLDAARKFISSFKKKLVSNEFIYIYIDKKLENLAIKIFNQQTSKNISFVDCTNIAIYQKYQLDSIFSFDKHYKKNGVVVL